MKLDLINNPKFQSAYTYLQAAGSDAADGTAQGIHLRWAFQKTLGDLHLAKGNLTPASTLGFNRPNDFVKIYRTPYDKKADVKIKFNNVAANLPTTEISSGATREWHYLANIPVPTVPANTTDVFIKFTDVAAYDAIRATMTTLKPKDMMMQYPGVIEIYANKLMFAIEFEGEIIDNTPPAGTNTYIRVESVALNDTDDATTKYVSCRTAFNAVGNNAGKLKKLVPGEPAPAGHDKKDLRLVCENMEHVRFDRANAWVKEIRLETYVDYIVLVNKQGPDGKWDFVGDFALTNVDATAFQRLEDPGNYLIDKKWPKFNEYDQSSGAFTVKTDNYEDKWLSPSAPTDGLKAAVNKYLNLTTTDLLANDSLPSETPDDNAQINVSYLNMLKLVGLDFHVARMLGIGHIDGLKQVGGGPNQQFIYALQYVTTADLASGTPGTTTVTHTFLTLPTGRKDYRLPPSPILTPVTYGLFAENGTGTPTPLTDPEGYSPYSDMRFINVNRSQFFYELPFGPFFYELTEFCLCKESLPVLFGMDYRKQAEADYRKPEISNDPSYTDFVGYPEVVPIPDTAENPIYIHRETEEGFHEYAMYSINWFSRISPRSNIQPTDETDFPKRNTLLPPFNLGVQLIQEEEPLILTTSLEQTMLQNYTASDKTLVRATFDWNHIHFNAHQFATEAEFFFRDTLALEVRGEITSVIQLPNHLVQITTGPYTITSTSPSEIVQPFISASDATKFIGSSLSANESAYVVENVLSTGNNPTFILRQIKQTNVNDPLLNNNFLITETYLSPSTGERYFISENLSNENNWDANLIKKVYLEKFSTNATIDVVGSVGNDKNYTIYNVGLVGSDTEIKVTQLIPNSAVSGDVVFKKTKRIIGVDTGTNSFIVQGDITADFSGLPMITVSASMANNGTYSVDSVSVISGNSHITLDASPVIPDPINFSGYLTYSKSYPIIGVDILNKSFLLSGNIIAELDVPHLEFTNESDGTISRSVPGGIFQKASIVEKPRVYAGDDPAVATPPPNPGDPIPNSRSGVYEITFDTFQLENHIDPEVSWYKGTIRIQEDPAFLPVGVQPEIKTLQIWNIDTTGATLKLLVIDSTLDYVTTGGVDVPNGTYVPILNGANVDVNFHPSYKLYLKADTNINPTTGGTNNFDSATILPSSGEGSRKTFVAVRSIDNSDPSEVIESYMHVPVVLLAQEIINPLPIGPPTGPLFATRPDFYGKATYTFDVKVDTTGGRVPFAVVFYRANEDRILDVLYKSATIIQIKSDLAALGEDLYFTDRWNDLINTNYNTSTGEYNTHGPSLFKFPLPDNDGYIIPNRNRAVIERPFEFSHLLNSNYTYVTDPSITRTFSEIIREAIQVAFVSLTEQPIPYNFIKTGTTTSNKKPVFKKPNGLLMLPTEPGFDFAPMAMKYVNGADTFIRFTDYSLDGAAKNVYFYFGIELSNRLQFGPLAANGIAGPIQLVNTNSAQAPEIKRVLTQLQNSVAGIPTAVKFELNNYIPSENIKKFQVYRTSDADDALSMRNMKMVKDVNVGDNVLDDFSDVSFPLYGDPLFYRLIALREIKNEFNQIELVPSLPSNLVMASIVDVVNPEAPKLQSENGTTTATELQNVVLKWTPTCYNGTYSLQKQNESGNWVEIFKIKSNEVSLQYPPLDLSSLPDFTNFPETAILLRQDSNGNNIYHRFRVKVENSSGLLNLTEKELTLAKGITDIQESDVVSYADSNFTLNPLGTQEVDEGVSHPVTMTFTDIFSPLPAGHNTFVNTDITVTDDLGNTFTKTINAVGGSVTFNHGDGGLILDNSNPNRVYTIITKTFTDYATTGASKKYILNYVSGPCHDLLQLSNSIISLTDSQHTISPLINQDIDQGVSNPGSFTFTDISDPNSIGQTFASLDVTLTDDLGNTFTKTISLAGGNVTFNQGDGGLQLDGTNPNRTYSIVAKLKTNLCSAGTDFSYAVTYIFTPCNQLTALTSIVTFTDGNTVSINPLTSQNITSHTHPNSTITMSEIISSGLPIGHTFTSMDVILEDDLGGSSLKTINAPSGNVVFNHGDGGLILDSSDPNRTYVMTVVLYTNLCTDGTVYAYQVKYGI